MPRPDHLPPPAEVVAPRAGSYLARIVQHLNEFGKTILPLPKNSKDKNGNAAALLAEAYLWDSVQRYAKKRSDRVWEEMDKAGLVDAPDDPGDHMLAETLHFMCAVKVTVPVKRFNAGVLATALQKKYKVPLPVSKEMIEAAKTPTKSIKTFEIAER